MSGVLLAFALAFLIAAFAVRRSTGVPWRRIASSDTIAWQRSEAPLIGRRSGLVGAPDYVVRVGRRLVPVEVKPGRRAQKPYASDIMQLAAYCLLIEETAGTRPPYGILRYAEATFQIPYDRRLRSNVLRLVGEMQAAAPPITARRSHGEPARCRSCGFFEQCDQAL